MDCDEPFPSDATDRQPDDAVLRRALMGLVEIGMAVAETVRREPEPAVAAEAFERVSRAVRRTVRMVRWLDEPVMARTVPAAGRVVPAAVQRVLARKRILRTVEDQIDRDADEAQAESLQAELLERLDGAELEDDLAHRPVPEIIAEIVHDLGLQRMPGRRAEPRRRPADVAALHARAAAEAGGTRDVAGPLLVLGHRRALADGWPPGPEAVPEEMATEDLVRLLARGRLPGQ